MKKIIIGIAVATGMLATAAVASIMVAKFERYNIEDEVNASLDVNMAQTIGADLDFESFTLSQNQKGFDWNHLDEEHQRYLERTAMTSDKPCPIMCGGGTKSK